MNTNDLKKKLKKKEKPKHELLGVSTGSTLLNLACTDKVDVGFLTGRLYLFVGDSSSGKSFLTLTSLAEACDNSLFDDHQIIYDNAENGALMSLKKFFGQKLVDRVSPPKIKDGQPYHSHTVEEFYFHVDQAASRGPFFYVLDSLDALEADDDRQKFNERKAAYEKGKTDVTGTYGTAKAKANSVGMRRLNIALTDTNSIVLVIAQTRANIGFDAMFKPKTRGGGQAPTFYAAMELWSSVKGKIKQTVRKKPVQTGIIAQVKVKKNRQTGREPTVDIPILHSYGIDDIGSCVRYLIEWDHWDGSEKRVEAPEFEYDGGIEGLVELIQLNNREADLFDIVQEVWDDIKKQSTPVRKQKYQ